MLKTRAILRQLRCRAQYYFNATLHLIVFMTINLSDRAKELIAKAKIVSFASWQEKYSQEIINIFQKAEDEKRYLSDGDLARIEEIHPEKSSALAKAKFLRENAKEIVDQARIKVLEKYPNITQAGGDLYPPIRAEACWRDFWQFLRCITYGIAGENTNYLSQEGLDNMELLYQELKIPLAAMVTGLENLKHFSLQEFTDSERAEIAPYFAGIIQEMKQFK